MTGRGWPSTFLLALIALALGWIALRPDVMPAPATAADVRAVNLERIGGHYIIGGAIPIRCADLKR